MFRVGIVGCGNICQVHSIVLDRHPLTQLVACADIKLERAQAIAEKYNCHAYASLEEMLENEQLDAVHLCTPHVLHTPMAEMLAERGITVFTEKPPVIDQQQWEALEKVDQKVPLGICFQNRYNPNVKETQRIIASGEYGKVMGARAFVTWVRTPRYYTDSGWRGNWEMEGGGVLMNQTIHTLDLLIYLLGKPEFVEATMANHHLKDVIQVEDTVEVYMRIQGKPAIYYATTGYVTDSPVLLEVMLEKATLRLEEDRLEIKTREGVEVRTFKTPETLGKGYWGNGHYTCIGDFYESIQEGRPFQNNLDSVRDTVGAMLEIYRQGKQHLQLDVK